VCHAPGREFIERPRHLRCSAWRLRRAHIGGNDGRHAARMRVKAPVLRVIACARATIWGAVHDLRVVMIMRVTGIVLMPRMTMMDGRLIIMMNMRRRGSSRQSGPGAEEHHHHKSHDLPDKSQPHISLIRCSGNRRQAFASNCEQLQEVNGNAP
jgi:hypothetical protein